MKGKELKFLEALLTEPTVTGACKKAGISKSTGYKYMKGEDFKRELKARQSEFLNSAVRYLQSNLELANETLVKILKDPYAADQIKINAANSIYNNSKIIVDAEATARLQEIEENIAKVRRELN